MIKADEYTFLTVLHFGTKEKNITINKHNSITFIKLMFCLSQSLLSIVDPITFTRGKNQKSIGRDYGKRKYFFP